MLNESGECDGRVEMRAEMNEGVGNEEGREGRERKKEKMRVEMKERDEK